MLYCDMKEFIRYHLKGTRRCLQVYLKSVSLLVLEQQYALHLVTILIFLLLKLRETEGKTFASTNETLRHAQWHSSQASIQLATILNINKGYSMH